MQGKYNPLCDEVFNIGRENLMDIISVMEDRWKGELQQMSAQLRGVREVNRLLKANQDLLRSASEVEELFPQQPLRDGDYPVPSVLDNGEEIENKTEIG